MPDRRESGFCTPNNNKLRSCVVQAELNAGLIEDEVLIDDGELVSDLDDMPADVAEDIAAAMSEEQLLDAAPQIAEIDAAEAALPGDVEAFAEFKVTELKELLKANGLKVSGKKQDLAERLVANGIAAPTII